MGCDNARLAAKMRGTVWPVYCQCNWQQRLSGLTYLYRNDSRRSFYVLNPNFILNTMEITKSTSLLDYCGKQGQVLLPTLLGHGELNP